MLTRHNIPFSLKLSPYLSQHHYSHHISLFTPPLNNQLTINSLVFPISIPPTQIFLQLHLHSLLCQKEPNQRSKSQNLHPRKIFKFHKTLLKQLLNLQRKTKLQLTNTIIRSLIFKPMIQIQLQKKVYPPQILLAHLTTLFQTQSLIMQIFLVF